jgi:small subunit ribosomal protein S20
MANHASAIKRNRQRIKRTDRNRAAKSALRSTLKKARAALATPGTSAEVVKEAVSALDRAASKGTIPAQHKAAQTAKG